VAGTYIPAVVRGPINFRPRKADVLERAVALAGRFDDALRASAESLRLRPSFLGGQRLQSASLAQAGRIEEARAVFAKLRINQPQLSEKWVRLNVPYQTPELLERFLVGLRKAGLKN
jgi:hypothetical protein